MHLPDGYLSTPVCLGTGLLAASLVGWALARTRGRLQERQAPLVGVTAAFVFAAQMVNYPVGPGVSGHVLGAALAAFLLGPVEAGLVLTLVVTLQALMFADGGLTALGANICNLGFVAPLSAWAVMQGLGWLLPRSLRKSRRGFLLRAGIASWFSTVATAAACGGELAVSQTTSAPALVLIGLLGSVHAVIGIGEALVTTAVLSAVLTARPEWIRAWSGGEPNMMLAESPRSPVAPEGAP